MQRINVSQVKQALMVEAGILQNVIAALEQLEIQSPAATIITPPPAKIVRRGRKKAAEAAAQSEPAKAKVHGKGKRTPEQNAKISAGLTKSWAERKAKKAAELATQAATNPAQPEVQSQPEEIPAMPVVVSEPTPVVASPAI